MGNNNYKIETFGNYMLLQKLAVGGMAEVFLARPALREGDGRLQVVKRILPHIANHAEFLNMFQREIQIIMGFNHAHVVQLHDFGSANGQPFIAMEYIEGKNLRDILEKLKLKNLIMPVPVALSLIAQAAAGLHYAHTFVNKTTNKHLQAVHRDISPHNLIVSYDGNLKVIDFGIAKAAGGVHDLTQTGTIKGKAAYFSPEQLLGGQLDARTDIFSLGAVAWELLTNERLFAKPGDTEVTAMARISNCEKHVVPPSSINRQIPPDVDKIILTALKKDPNERFLAARDFQLALRKALMSHYPAYTYADTGELVSVLFAEELATERKHIQDLNTAAQDILLGGLNEKTVPIMIKQNIQQVPTISQSFNHFDKSAEAIMDSRLSKLEATMKQKASTRHYVMLAVYIVSIFALKVGEHYDYWFDFGTSKAKASEMIVRAPPPHSMPTPAQMPAARPTVAAQQIHAQQQPRTTASYAAKATAKTKKLLRGRVHSQ